MAGTLRDVPAGQPHLVAEDQPVPADLSLDLLVLRQTGQQDIPAAVQQDVGDQLGDQDDVDGHCRYGNDNLNDWLEVQHTGDPKLCNSSDPYTPGSASPTSLSDGSRPQQPHSGSGSIQHLHKRLRPTLQSTAQDEASAGSPDSNAAQIDSLSDLENSSCGSLRCG